MSNCLSCEFLPQLQKTHTDNQTEENGKNNKNERKQVKQQAIIIQ